MMGWRMPSSSVMRVFMGPSSSPSEWLSPSVELSKHAFHRLAQLRQDELRRHAVHELERIGLAGTDLELILLEPFEELAHEVVDLHDGHPFHIWGFCVEELGLGSRRRKLENFYRRFLELDAERPSERVHCGLRRTVDGRAGSGTKASPEERLTIAALGIFLSCGRKRLTIHTGPLKLISISRVSSSRLCSSLWRLIVRITPALLTRMFSAGNSLVTRA